MKWYKGLTITKDPSDIVDYLLDFSSLLKEDNITSFSIVSDNLSIISTNRDGNKITVFIGGGVNCSTAVLTCTINTAGGRTYERSINVKISDL